MELFFSFTLAVKRMLLFSVIPNIFIDDVQMSKKTIVPFSIYWIHQFPIFKWENIGLVCYKWR